MGADERERAREAIKQEQVEEAQQEEEIISISQEERLQRGRGMERIDVLAVAAIIVLAASFAVTARLNAQPASSLTPAAVLSATGCGLLVTAVRKLRTIERPGLPTAGVSGFIVALFQFVAAISYPGVLGTLEVDEAQKLGFLGTWALVGVCSVLFAMVGAALGHLAFAPLRPLPGHRDTDTGKGQAEQRSFFNYLISVVLLGLAPALAGLVFSAAFDYMLNFYALTPGPYPTLRLLSGLLPWQVPIQANLGAVGAESLTLLLWRIPVFIGNASMFDVQGIEACVFNAAALALLLLTMHGRGTGKTAKALPLKWLVYLGLEFALGLCLVLPADLWMLGGLQGLLHVPSLGTVIPIPELRILDTQTFGLNLVTGPAICVLVGVLLRPRRQRSSIEAS